jgi:hypothetical protein
LDFYDASPSQEIWRTPEFHYAEKHGSQSNVALGGSKPTDNNARSTHMVDTLLIIIIVVTAALILFGASWHN